jgi:6-phosphogluconolactonase
MKSLSARSSSLGNARRLAALAVVLLLTACGGGGGGGDGGGGTTPPATYTVGGSISGLAGSGLALAINGGGNLSVAASSTTFTFSSVLQSGNAYAVTVATQPSSPAQTCTVANGSGTVGTGNVSNVSVTCKTNSFQIGGTISGLAGSGLVLEDNGGDSLTVSAGATTFTFATAVQVGGAYAVTVKTQPSSPKQVCNVSGGTGTVSTANVTSVSVSCANVGRFVYVANYSDGSSGLGDVSAFTIDQTSGALTAVPGGPITADSNPAAIVADRTGQFLYVCNEHTSDISIFTIDQTSGALTAKNLTDFTPGTAGTSIAVAPSNAYLYAGGFGSSGSTGAIAGFTLNEDSGSLTDIANKPAGAGNTPYGLAIDPTSSFLFATTAFENSLWVYSIGTGGALTPVANNPFSAGAGTYGVAVSPRGTSAGGFVYVTDSQGGSVRAFAYDPTGNLTPVAGSPYAAGNTPEGITIDPTGSYLYVANYGDGTVSAFTIDASSGALTPLGTPVATGNLTSVPNPGPIDVKMDASGEFVYVVNNLDGSVSLFTPNAGALTLTATYPTGAGAVAVAVD